MTEALQIDAIPAFSDNYIWLLRGPDNRCAVVDPGDHEPVLNILSSQGLELCAILLTHHHWDHAGGVPDLLEHFDAVVYGPNDDRLGDWCQPCKEGDTVTVPELGLTFDILDVPAHTRSHIAFHGHGLLFSGDTLFSVGCGRLFEGSPEEMQVAMDKLRLLPDDTLVYCGHEYTESNCDFALQVEPDNSELQEKARSVRHLRSGNANTLPSTMGEEKATNPFLRTREPAVVRAALERDPTATAGAATLGVIRSWKDAS